MSDSITVLLALTIKTSLFYVHWRQYCCTFDQHEYCVICGIFSLIYHGKGREPDEQLSECRCMPIPNDSIISRGFAGSSVIDWHIAARE